MAIKDIVKCAAGIITGAAAGALAGANKGADLAGKVAPGDPKAARLGAIVGGAIGGAAGGFAGGVAGCGGKSEGGKEGQKIASASTTATVGWILILASESLPQVPSTLQIERNQQLILATSLASPILWASGITLQFVAGIQAAT